MRERRGGGGEAAAASGEEAQRPAMARDLLHLKKGSSKTGWIGATSAAARPRTTTRDSL
jgi:hypothetical protein